MDYADQRYYASGGGRFLTPDPGGINTANPSDPASWNRYAYVQGDPVNFKDPKGLLQAAAEDDEDGWDWWWVTSSLLYHGGGMGGQAGATGGAGGPAPADPLELVKATTALQRQNAARAVANLGEGCEGVFNDPSRNIGTATLYQALQFNATSATYVDNFGPPRPEVSFKPVTLQNRLLPVR